MKKVICLIIFFSLLNFSSSFGQIIYESSYSPTPLLKYFNHTSPKWMTHPTATDIYLYDLNHSQYRHIIIPVQSENVNVLYLTEDLFDTDSTNFEYLLSTSNPADTSFVKIYREDGTLLFQRDSAWMILTAFTANTDYHDNIIATDNGTKMMLRIQNPSNLRTEIYSLPGTVPCPMVCNNAPWFLNGVEPPENSYDNTLRLPYPNPASGQIHIPFTLPDGETSGEIILYDMTAGEVKRYKVDKTFQDLILSTSDLSAGSYYYQFQTAHSISEGRKLIVIK